MNPLIIARSTVKRQIVLWCAVGALALAGCKGKVQPREKAMPPDHPPIPMGQAPEMMPPAMGPGGGGERPFVIPEGLKGKYTGVELRVEEKGKETSKTYMVGLHKSLTLPGSDLVIEVGDYLPSLSVGDSEVTSGLEETNPAVKVRVTEKGKELYSGWLFQNFPDVHPFQHERFALTLKRGIKKT